MTKRKEPLAPGRLEVWPIGRLKPHGENRHIFGAPFESPAYEAMVESVGKVGILEPLVVREDGVVLAGHMRLACAKIHKLKELPVRIVPPFADLHDEVAFIIRSNTDRRQLNKREIALAFQRLRQIPRAQGGTKGQRGRPRLLPAGGSEPQNIRPKLGRNSEAHRADKEAAKELGVSRNTARALEAVFTTDGVPPEVRESVEKGTVGAIRAARAIREVKAEQGGKIADPAILMARIAARNEADRKASPEGVFAEVFADMVLVERHLDGALARLPLAAVTTPDQHHQYRQVIYNIAVRAWREIERVEGPSQTGKQLHLTLVHGGRA